jgi:integrase
VPKRKYPNLFKKPDSQFYHTRFYIRGQEFKVSTGETDIRRAAQAGARIRQKALAETEERPSGLGSIGALSAEDTAETIDRGVSQVQIDNVKQRWKRILAWLGSDTPPSAITGELLQRFVNERRRAGLRGQSIRKYTADIRRILVKAEKRGWISKLPEFPSLPSDEKDSRRAGKLVPPQVVRAVLKEAAPDAAPAAEFCILTGLRLAEVCRVRWSFIQDAPEGSSAAAILVLPKEATKNRRGRTVGLSLRALQVANMRYSEVGDLLFPHKSYTQAMVRACRRLKLPYTISMRDLRHSFASNALKASGNLAAVSKALGHSEVETTALYLHAEQQDIIDLAAHMDAIMGPAKQAQRANSPRSTLRKPAKQKSFLERETGFEPATSCLGSKLTSEKTNVFNGKQEACRATKGHVVQGDTGPGPGPVTKTGPGDGCSVICLQCGRVGGTDECAFCGSASTQVLQEYDRGLPLS